MACELAKVGVGWSQQCLPDSPFPIPASLPLSWLICISLGRLLLGNRALARLFHTQRDSLQDRS